MRKLRLQPLKSSLPPKSNNLKLRHQKPKPKRQPLLRRLLPPNKSNQQQLKKSSLHLKCKRPPLQNLHQVPMAELIWADNKKPLMVASNK